MLLNINSSKYFRIALQLILAVVFLISAYSKFISPGLIEIILVDQGITASRNTAAYLVRILLAVEFAIGILYLQPFSIKKIVIPASTALLLFFTGYLFYTGFILGDKENCGCFGTLIEMSPVESIIKNVVLIILSAPLYRMIKEKKENFVIPVVALTASLVFVFAFAPIRDVKDFKFEKYKAFVGEGRVDLSGGEKLLAVFSLDCEHCRQTAKEIARLTKANKKIPPVYVLFFSEGGVSVDEFNKMTNSDFPYHMIETNEFFDLIGSTPPRIYWLSNGTIKEHWDADFEENIDKNFR
ncbi:MAG: hypothetical protein HYS25_07940 [Ignavibacteriales bacterium]|nr:hypothetical protein [Ignavibacteriales bacterium]